jgi:hypothetical protein
MNHDLEKIERLLREAPAPRPSEGLRERLEADIRLARPVVPGAVGWQAWRRWIPAMSFALGLLLAAGAFAFQAVETSRLRAENEALRESLKNAEGGKEMELERLKQEAAELERLRREAAELEQLRVMVASLRDETQALIALQAENQELRARLTAMRSSGEHPLDQAMEDAHRIRCVNNMKNIGLAARIYASDHEDVFPPDWMAMKWELSTPKILHCSADVGRTRTESWEDFGPANVSYIFVTPGLSVGETPVNTVLARCPIHENITLYDGSVQQAMQVLAQGRAAIVDQNGHQVFIMLPEKQVDSVSE